MRYGILLVVTGAVLYPLLAWYSTASFPLTEADIFPALGLFAFSVMWLHIVGGPFRPWIQKMFRHFDYWMLFSSAAVFIAIILHPLLLLTATSRATGNSVLAFFSNVSAPIRWAIIGWFMLILYDVARPFKKYLVGTAAWYVITLISTLGFFLILFHSLELGSNLQSGPLRFVWIFYGATAACAAAYTYGIRPLLNFRRSKNQK